MQNASSYWSIGTTLWSGYKYMTSPSTIDLLSAEDEEILEYSHEPLSLIISLAVALLLPIKSKPSLMNHRITWDRPSPVALFGGIVTLDCQGWGRETKQICSTEVANHLPIIKRWPQTIEIALRLHRIRVPTDNLRRKFLIDFFFDTAKKGLDTKVGPTYALKTDGTVENIERSSISIDLDNQYEAKLEAKNKKDSTKSIPEGNSQNGEKEIEKPKEEQPAEISQNEKNQSESSDEEARTPAMKIKNIWKKMCYLETVYELYIEASLIPESERETNNQFTHCINAIYGIINQRSGEYDLVLRKIRKIVI
ncbi:MAG: hypothetical protein H0T62_12995 [Parachlamydiaceae bacterium]|nr:hypothetical protein [Parachlamydiaceae bacterium]